jgi:diguanylate cyclase (GGDEF)-like protein
MYVDVALLALGAVLGALAFSFVVGRRRARAVARLADRLAQAASGEPSDDPVHVADPVLDDALQRLAVRIAEVESLAATDQLTRLLNRPACLSFLGTEIDRANRYERPLTVALIDIDHFKRINDTYGHVVGDDVLRHVAGVLRSSIRAVDGLGRYGGEEFLLVMPETDLDGGLASAENARRVVGRTPLMLETPTGATEIRVTISVGVAGHAGVPSLDVDRLLREADGAMYEAKERGRDQVQAHRPFDDYSSLSRATIDARARNEAAKIAKAAFEASNNHLLSALSERAGWAGGASELIANLAAELGRAIGLPDGDIDRIRTASLLHDLGKLAIPDEILSKPGPLSPPEWRTIVEHPKIGQVVLEQAGAIRDAAAIVLHHHEWFDGRGYPHGLAGAEIPVGSRIVAIADAYEAMISDRPYSAAMSHADALEELVRQRGIQFDPDLVDIFISLVGDGSGPLIAGQLSIVAVPGGDSRGKATRAPRRTAATRSERSRAAARSKVSTARQTSNGRLTANGTSAAKPRRGASLPTGVAIASAVKVPKGLVNHIGVPRGSRDRTNVPKGAANGGDVSNARANVAKAAGIDAKVPMGASNRGKGLDGASNRAAPKPVPTGARRTR